MTYIVTWPEQKNMQNPHKGESIKMCLWNDGNSLQPFLGFGGRKRLHELFGGGIIKVLDGENHRD